MADGALDELVASIQESAKYRRVSPDLVQAICRRELAAHRSRKDATKATKNKLHQIYGAFFTAEPQYAAWLDDLAAARATDAESWRAASLRILRRHTSSAERLPFLDRFYTTILAHLPPIHSVIDVACGLNPLALPWMPLAADVTYSCYDIDAGMIAFLNGYCALAGIRGEAVVRDIAAYPPTQQADLALVLKTAPTLEQLRNDAGGALLRSLQATHLVVSFPLRSLGGRDKRMPAHYESWFMALARTEPWQIERFAFPNELVFLVHRRTGH